MGKVIHLGTNEVNYITDGNGKVTGITGVMDIEQDSMSDNHAFITIGENEKHVSKTQLAELMIAWLALHNPNVLRMD